MCSRTMVDINQEWRVFIHLFCRNACVIRKNIVPLHRQKVNRLDCFRLVVIFIVLGF